MSQESDIKTRARIMTEITSIYPGPSSEVIHLTGQLLPFDERALLNFKEQLIQKIQEARDQNNTNSS